MVMVSESEPGVVASGDSSNRRGPPFGRFGSRILFALTNTSKPPAGAGWPMLTVPLIWRLLPMVTPSVTLSAGAPTVTASVVNLAGVLNPDGVLTDRVVEPPVMGWKWVMTLFDPPEIDTGEIVTAPMFVFELVTLTLAVVPPA